MADPNEKNPLNVTGRYYNDTSCIDCDFCRGHAPHIFTRDDDEGLTYVWRQPETREEIALAEEAIEGCPAESIGSDGVFERPEPSSC